MAEERPLLEARQVFKGFFGNPVLKGVNIALLPGRVHALLGENGAGKSTLINLLSGALQPDSGSILIDAKPVGRFSPAAARAAGIAVVQQELSLTASLSIAENIGIGAFPRRLGFIDYGALHRGVRDVCEMVGLTEPLDLPVADLALGRRQMVEIAKALFRKPRVLILDEPTSSLSAHEAGILARLIETLSARGTALLYISHRLNEVQSLCSHVTVLKDGLVTADQSLSGIDGEGLVRLMVGRETGDLFPPRPAAAPGDTRIQVEGFSAGMVRDIDLSARAGEIVGIGGLVGQGQEDLLLGLYGAIPAAAARAQISGKRLPAHVREANAAGIVYVPADRKHEGLVLPHSIASNLILPSLGRLAGKGLRDRQAENGLVADLARRLTIKGDTARPVQALSGGNQQKVALAKWLPLDPAVLLLNDPTRGVDIETKREIYLMLRAFAAEGRLVILASSDTPELVHLCDRVVVLREGRIAAVLSQDEISEGAIVGAAMGIATAAQGEAA
ncbi:sugar ABC transporter ATP-binding protein [Rhizobium lentis]|uniref:sugar ABC transporter ATP-binding protein n=1 Tax=Rhizobium lentis TaxID=1138194 RepID=UPI001C834619|nr:sugar ABC transporter ATP-binding protein [Rhizobium lentis]MBX4999445.1 sugar ABC transporter ATP-binding protein [Rhizobium lentis]MBX5015269.1 sugar ABC transporter ATP-binding protein [Rhizobium lentis]MBX5043724.1 sugar ABC transporter ATP-binding protein [Rhizobium lentis]MBX5055927.1 sugar ABC transporter ATP-binding protein [Rhizobium lentis]MBX5073881.1 sugar ABC transporter ATP-binding protein [Rhizobium lentis]